MILDDFILSDIRLKIIEKIDGWNYENKEQIIEKILLNQNIDRVTLCKCGNEYYFKEGKDIIFSIIAFLTCKFTYKHQTYNDIMSEFDKAMGKYEININVIDGNEKEKNEIKLRERERIDRFLFDEMERTGDNIPSDRNMKWCVCSMKVGSEPEIIECDSKVTAWQEAIKKRDKALDDTNIIRYMVALLCKEGDNYERDSNGRIIFYEKLDVMAEK